MCVAAIAWQAHPRWRLVAIGNRDEFHDRPAAPLARWDNGVIAGRDLEGGGTWLGMGPEGRFALVTNFRAPGYPKPGLASRGELVTSWLASGWLPQAGLNPFHLAYADSTSAWHLTNQPRLAGQLLAHGIHGLSNGAFDNHWPKTVRLCNALGGWLAEDTGDIAPLFNALADRTPLPHEPGSDGPDVPYSPVFVCNETYGTRCSTVVLIGHDGSGKIVERRFTPSGAADGETRIPF